jgi:hypothetical protein
MSELTCNEKAILDVLRADAAQCGKIYHFSPQWVANKADLTDFEFREAARSLAARGLISLHEFEWQLVKRFMDIALIDDSIPAAFPHGEDGARGRP